MIMKMISAALFLLLTVPGTLAAAPAPPELDATSSTTTAAELQTTLESVTAEADPSAAPGDPAEAAMPPEPAVVTTRSGIQQSTVNGASSVVVTGVRVRAYGSDYCTGAPKFDETFNGGKFMCQAVKVPDSNWFSFLWGGKKTAYGKMWCTIDSEPVLYMCDDSSCNSCQRVTLVGDGVCGSGLGYWSSAKATCPQIQKGNGYVIIDGTRYTL